MDAAVPQIAPQQRPSAMRRRRPRTLDQVRNPFRSPLITELIDDPELYQDIFSEEVLIGETLEVFQPTNTVLVGPQGSGKSMLLNFLRYQVLGDWLRRRGSLPAPLQHVQPFLGISINLQRAYLQTFGRRSVSQEVKGRFNLSFELACAADYINTYLLREFLKAADFLTDPRADNLRHWLAWDVTSAGLDDLATTIASWSDWAGYYQDQTSFSGLLKQCEGRLSAWLSFLNMSTDSIPRDVLEGKSTLGLPLHSIGNLVTASTGSSNRTRLFVVVDQYEVLPELNETHGTSLQRLLNTLIKARDPAVFYKVGSRTSDWGRELRIWGSRSRIEVRRDYIHVDLTKSLLRPEGNYDWLFSRLALDVAYKRLTVLGDYRVARDAARTMLGPWSPELETEKYASRASSNQRHSTIGLPPDWAEMVIHQCGEGANLLELRLASAWVHQQLKRGLTKGEIAGGLQGRPWQRRWWRWERIGTALLQIAASSNQRKLYFGWQTVLSLSGANITAFLMILSEIWDVASKAGRNPLHHRPIDALLQTEGVYVASESWLEDDSQENGGDRRYNLATRLGPALQRLAVRDRAISNPGFSGFSIQDTELADAANPLAAEVATALLNAISWAILEERSHPVAAGSRQVSRRDIFLHPLLSPLFRLPHQRVQRPIPLTVRQVHSWLFTTARIRLRSPDANQSSEDGVQIPLELPTTR
jgi:hypothetical protein